MAARKPRYAMDISNFWIPDGSLKSEDEANALLASPALSSYKRAVCGTQVPSVTVQQVLAAHRAGKDVQLYMMMPWTTNTQTSGIVSPVYQKLQDANWVVGWLPTDIGRPMLWLDCETGIGQLRPGVDVKNCISFALLQAELMGWEYHQVGIYTNPGWWNANMAGWQTMFRSRKLWLASWDGLAVKNHSNVVIPGGWTKDDLSMRQYDHDLVAGGVKFDVSVY